MGEGGDLFSGGLVFGSRGANLLAAQGSTSGYAKSISLPELIMGL